MDFIINSGTSSDGSGMEEMCGGFKLNRTQRFIGFGACFGGGFIVTILSSLFLATGNILLFALFYTFGNILSLMSTGFLIGFGKQVKKMFDSSRLISTIIYLASIVATLLVAILLGSVFLVIICLIVQFFALFWYSASYVPFVQDMIKNCFKGLVGGSS
ncbi:SFT2 domain-containing protein [Zopfochytrium polystomum]|nr:SFT2 domain-containing protein [Zopfochytrium polystomum]